MLCRLLTMALLLTVPATAAARNIFVNNVAGDDRREGRGEKPSSQGTGPCRTIEKALRVAQEGDIVVLANTGEPYRESISLDGPRHSGAFATPFIIEGNGATLDGTKEIPVGAWQQYDQYIFRFRPLHRQYQQLYLDGIPCRRVDLLDDGELPELEPLDWCLADGFVYFRCEQDRLPQTYDLRFAYHRVGVTLYQVRRVVVRDLVVQGFQLDGINAHDNVFETTLSGVTSRGNGRSGISIGGASRVQIENCLVGDNGKVQIRTEGYSKTQIDRTEIIANTGPAITRDGGSVTTDGEKMTARVKQD